MEPAIYLNDVFQYLKELKLEKPTERFDVRRTRGPVQTEVVKEGAEQAFLSDKSLVSFASGVTDQNRKDVLNSTLLAQLAANKKSPIDTGIEKWYEAFVEVLEKIGWVVQEKELHQFEAKESVFELENVIIDILTASFGAGYISIIKKTLESLKNLTESEDSRIKVFEKNTRSTNKGCFQIALATEEGGVVAMKIGAFFLSSTNKVTRILFVKFTSDQTKLDYASSGLTLNQEIYAKARQLVIDKLSQDVVDYITEIEI
jgi:hypothetical protein